MADDRFDAVILRAAAPLASTLLALAACSSDEAAWQCCQTTVYTCVCASSGYCASDARIEGCSAESVPGDASTCCVHGASGTCSCSGSDGGTLPDACSAEGDYPVDDCSEEPSGPPSSTCEPSEPGTNGAACASDSECFGAFCDLSSGEGACATPTREARVADHGYDCATDADCEAAAPSFVAKGGVATCESSAALFGCAFACE